MEQVSKYLLGLADYMIYFLQSNNTVEVFTIFERRSPCVWAITVLLIP